MKEGPMKTLLHYLIFVVASLLILPATSFSGQFDAPYYTYETRHKGTWEKQDKKIDEKLAAIRYEDFKIHIKAAQGGLPGMDFYNVKRDPGEKYGQLYPGLFSVAPIQMFLQSHMEMIQKYPHRDPSESKAQKQ